jgi:hypothetical protein
MLQKTYPTPKQYLILLLVYRKHNHDRICAGMGEVMQALSAGLALA